MGGFPPPLGMFMIPIVNESVKHFCSGCKNEIDLDLCYCGDFINDHNAIYCGHNPVPQGCTCGYDKSVDMHPDGSRDLDLD